jgi:hypothetical protein
MPELTDVLEIPDTTVMVCHCSVLSNWCVFNFMNSSFIKMAVFWVAVRVDWYMITNVSEVCAASIIRALREAAWMPALIMQAVRTSETLVNFYLSTRRYNPEDSHLHNQCRENLKTYSSVTTLIPFFYILVHCHFCV